MGDRTEGSSKAFDLRGGTLSDAHSITRPLPKSGIVDWSLFCQSIQEAVVVIDTGTGTIVSCSPAAERLTGVFAADVVGLPLESILSNRGRARFHAGTQRHPSQGSDSMAEPESPLQISAVGKDGAEFTVEYVLTPRLEQDVNNDGDPLYTLVLLRDVTERDRLDEDHEREVASAQEHARQLEECASVRSCFRAMVAHELIASTAAIGALAQLLMRGSLENADYQSIGHAVCEEISIISRLAKDLQAISAIQPDAFAVRKAGISVAALVAGAVTFARSTGSAHVVREHVEADALDLQIEGDPDRLGQVLRNILGNAFKHTPPGTRVDLRVSLANEFVRFEVVDNGPGIPEADLKRVLEKYARAREVAERDKPANRLGRYLALQILWAHDSDLHVSSQPGEKTSFSFVLERSG